MILQGKNLPIAEFGPQKLHKGQVGTVATYNASMQDTDMSGPLLQDD